MFNRFRQKVNKKVEKIQHATIEIVSIKRRVKEKRDKKNFKELFNEIEKFALSESQVNAATSHAKETLVIAGAGSGKTSLLIGRAKYLIESNRAKPENILMMAFNKDAAKEIIERSNALNLKIEATTFHAFGNKIIRNQKGNSKVMFTSHIDTASRDKSKVNLRKLIENNEEFVITDGTTILGADDKAGVAVMMYMMHHNIPGIYYIFIGEERGGIGSHAVARDFESFPFLKDVDKCISFDRRNYHSVITSQLGQTCCSESFGVALVNELNAAGLDMKLDNTGVYTDSASFIDIIPECTNISVGYFNEHTGNEKQNLTFLKRLAEASIKVKWESLPSERKVGLSEELMFQFGDLIKDYKRINFNCVTTLSEGFYKDSIQLSLEVSENYLEVLEDLYDIEKLTNKHMAPTIVAYEDYYILIDIFKN